VLLLLKVCSYCAARAQYDEEDVGSVNFRTSAKPTNSAVKDKALARAQARLSPTDVNLDLTDPLVSRYLVILNCNTF